MPSQKLWGTCKESLRDKLTPHNYESWIDPIECESFRGGDLSLKAPSRFFVEWIEEHPREVMAEQAAKYEHIDWSKLERQQHQLEQYEEAVPF